MLRKTMPAFILAAGLFVVRCDSDSQAERGTAAEAQAMVAAAIAYFDANGAEVTFTKFTDNPAPEFLDRDLYVFVIGVNDRLIKAHGSDSSRLGTDITTIIDVDGKNVGEAILTNATPSGAWVDYKWEDPITEETHPKQSWVRVHASYIFGVGIYIP